jgi:hypothetical protein
MPKYTSQEEDNQIKHEYESGQFTYRTLGEKHNLSKSSVINIVRNYPYGGLSGHRAGKSGQEAFIERVYRRIQQHLDTFDSFISGERAVAIECGDISTLSALTTVSTIVAIIMLEPMDRVEECLKRERLSAEKEAWVCLSEGNLTGFSVFKKIWIGLSTVMGESLKDPWADVINTASAKYRANSIKYESVVKKPLTYMPHESHIAPKHALVIDPATWTAILGIIDHRTPRQAVNRSNTIEKYCMQVLLDAMLTGSSVRAACVDGAAARCTVSRYFAAWFGQGVFTDLREMATGSSVLKPVLAVLDELERVRIVFGDTATPRLHDICLSAEKRAKKIPPSPCGEGGTVKSS